jgi:hypothetical protein
MKGLRAVTFVVFVVVVLFMVGTLVFESLGPAGQRRAHGFQVLRQEMADLPPAPGSRQTRRSASDRVPLPGPIVLETGYHRTGSCSDVHTYYVQEAEANGWTLVYSEKLIHTSSDNNPDYDELQSRFSKAADDFSLQITIGCYIGQSQPDYDAIMEVVS